MKTWFESWIVRLVALMCLASGAFAQEREPFRQHELDQMLAPIALYPDSLLSQILMASTYPLEVVQASRWVRANPGLRGRNAVQAVEQAEHLDWDPSVKSLVAFPQVLSMMDEKLEWTERLGEAFLAQPGDVMDSVQALRRRAEAAGNLGPSERMQVAREGEIITIAPPAPEIVYVPYYDPRVVYGPWWWPAHPPVYWAPAPAYYAVPAYRPAFLWGSGIAISAGFFFGHADWHHRHVTVAHRHPGHVAAVHAHGARSAWQHDARHRRGVPFRNPAARQRFEQRIAAAPASPAPRAAAPARARAAGDARQRRVDDRPRAAGQGRDSRTAELRELAPLRATASGTGNARPPASREAVQARPAPRPVTRTAQPELRARPASPQQIAARGDRNDALPRARPAAAPEARRVERPAPPRPQAITPVARPAAAAPAPRPTAAAPVRRVESRAAPRVQANPRPAAARAAPPARLYATGNDRRAPVAGRPRGN